MILSKLFDGNTLEPPRVGSRLPSLDGFRAISILLVIVAHGVETKNVPRMFGILHGLGNYGVKFFFVISGFLITTLLLKEWASCGSVSLKKFYARRTLRIFPALYTYIAIIAAFHFAGVIDLKPGDLIHSLTYTMNYHHVRDWHLNHTWSLGVEEQFYLLWPSVLVLLGPRRAMLAAAATLVLSPLARAVMYYYVDVPPTAMTREFQAVADALATGCLMAGCYNWLGSRESYLKFLNSPFFWLIPLIMFVVPPISFKLNEGAFYVFTQSVSNICAALIIDRWVRYPADVIGTLLNNRVMVYIGCLSYSLYLWQEPFLNPFSKGNFFTSFPQNLLFSFGMAALSYHFVEMPFLSLKQRSARISSVDGTCKS